MANERRTVACELEYDGAYGSCIHLAGEVADELDDIKCMMCDTLGVSSEEENAIKMSLGVTNHSFAVIAENVDCGERSEDYHTVAHALSSAIQNRLREMYGVVYNVTYNANEPSVDEFAGGFSDVFKFEQKRTEDVPLSKQEKEIISEHHPLQGCSEALGQIVGNYVAPRLYGVYETDELEQLVHKAFEKALLSPENTTPYEPNDIKYLSDIHWNDVTKQDGLIMDVYFKNGTMLHEFEAPFPSGGSTPPPSSPAAAALKYNPDRQSVLERQKELERQSELEKQRELERWKNAQRLSPTLGDGDEPPYPGKDGPEICF